MTQEQKEQLAEEYALGRAILLCPMDANSIHVLHGTKEDYKEVFLAGYNAAVNDFKNQLELYKEWFAHIQQLADDCKTANYFKMSVFDTLNEIKAFSKESVESINIDGNTI